MSSEEGRRKLAAILAADVAGYSRLMAADDRGTVAALKQAREVFRERIEARSGRLIDTAGDSVLAEFPSVVEAVECAVAVQERLAEINASLPEDRRMLFRIGVNQGDVIEEADGTVYGGGVNVAARLEGLAEPGTIAVSARVYDDVEDRLDIGFVDIGEHEVKNIAKPVRAYKVLPKGAQRPVSPTTHKQKLSPVHALAAALVVVVAILGIVVWQAQQDDGGGFGEVAVAPTGEAEEVDPVLALPTGPSIAVLPFDNLSGDPEQEYFVDGLTEQIITELTYFEDLFVIARNSTFRYKGQSVDVREVGRDLGVKYVLEGSVRKAGNTIRGTAQLLDANTGGHLWADDYERALSADNIFALQDDISGQVVSVLGDAYGVISRARMSRATAQPTDSLDAFDCVLRARAYSNAFTPELHLAARNCLERAVEIAPDYVDAWTSLARIYLDQYWSGFNPRPDDSRPLLDLALATAQKAVELGPDNSNAQYMLSRAHYFRHELPEFYTVADRAIGLNPNNAAVLAEVGLFTLYTGRWERGKALLDKALALNPYLPGVHYYGYSNYYYHRNEYEKALEAAVKLNLPGLYWTHIVFAEIYGQLGRNVEATQAVKELLRLYPGFNLDTAREEMRFWSFTGSHIEHRVEGLRKAGVPEAPAPPSRPVIAVLPFDNLSGDPEQEYFADGITEDIITRLAQYPDILVLGRNTTFQFKGQAVDIPTIAEKLGADYVVEGSIRRGGDTVRVTAQLLGGESWGHIWAETYDRALDPASLFAVQDEITGAVASRLAGSYGVIGGAEAQRLSRQAPEHLSSYDCVLRVFEYIRNSNPANHDTARTCLLATLEAEPNYGDALAYLGELYMDEVNLGFNTTADSSMGRALEILKQAVSVDPMSGTARVRLAAALFYTDNPDGAVREAEEALRLSPNDVDVMSYAAWLFASAGAYARTEEMMANVTRLNPNYPLRSNWIMAKVHLGRGEYAEAIRRLEMTQMEWFFWTTGALAASYCALGDLERGHQALAATLQAKPNFAEVYWPENHYWNKGADVQPIFDNLADGLRACGWEVPPDPGPEAFAQ